MELSLSAAARATGRSKSTVGRAIKSGKLSARRDDAGGYLIDASELARAFDWDPHAGVPQRVTGSPGPSEAPSVPVAVLKAKLALLEEALNREREALAHERETLAHERETTADLRQRLDRSDGQVRALLSQAASVPPPPAPARGLLARLLGR